jgi:hypothetical protein
MAKTTHEVVREIALHFPETEEIVSHGSPNFRVKGGRIFATFAVNHHGDGRIALWLRAPPAAQEHHVKSDPKHFFVPPYVGPSGWLGVRLDKGLSWKRVAALVRTAYEQVAPPRLSARVTSTPVVAPPTRGRTLAELDPMHTHEAQRAVQTVRKICLALPETSEGTQFGKPVWRVGKRVFAQVYRYDRPVHAAFWVGVARQGLMTMDPRYTIPAYLGHNGWIALDVTRVLRTTELRELALQSYRHFALKRILAALDDA